MTPTVRLLLTLVLLLTQVLAIGESAHAQEFFNEWTPRVVASWNPRTITGADLAGICPTPKQADAPCPIERGMSYDIAVPFTVDNDSLPLLIDVDGGGLEIEAFSASTGADYTPALLAGESDTINLTIHVPESESRDGRNFYIGKVRLYGAGPVPGALIISLTVAQASVRWTRPIDPESGDRAPLLTVIGSGETIERHLTLTSNLSVAGLDVRTNTNNASVDGMPDVLDAGIPANLTLTYTAPIVTRRTRADIVLSPVNGRQPVSSRMRLRVLILPAVITWNPPMIRESLNVQDQKPTKVRVMMTSNYDVPGVRFKTADQGLTPIISPINPVDLKAGVPQPVEIWLCPGYAPTTYFLGVTAYQGNRPLYRRLQLRMRVEDNGQPLPVGDPCGAP